MGAPAASHTNKMKLKTGDDSSVVILTSEDIKSLVSETQSENFSNAVPSTMAVYNALQNRLSNYQEAENAGKIFVVGENGYVELADNSSGGSWGSITGTLSAQTDLNTALESRSVVFKTAIEPSNCKDGDIWIKEDVEIDILSDLTSAISLSIIGGNS